MGRTFRAENLVGDFGSRSGIVRQAVAALAKAAGEQPALARWRTLFGRANGCDTGGRFEDIEKLLCRCYPTLPKAADRPGGPGVLLFALHTYYAAVVQGVLHRCCRAKPRDDPLDGLFSWHDEQPLSEQLNQAFSAYRPEPPRHGNDLLKPLYEDLFPRALRHQLGEYYTPDWLAEHLLDQLGYSGDPKVRLLDPACGSGTFLLAAIRRILAGCEEGVRGQRPGVRGQGSGIRDQGLGVRDQGAMAHGRLCGKILANVAGFDLNPLAVMTAKANYLIALAEFLPQTGEVEIPVYLRDSILDSARCSKPFDLVVGNPPWIAWDNLPEDYRQATKPLWEHYGLFSLSGSEARHGGAKKDLSMLMLQAAADRYLRDGGRLAMVITQTVFQTKGAGEGFRRFRLGPDGKPLRVLRVDDMVALKPFDDAANFTSTILLEKGPTTEYPVAYVKWVPGGDGERSLKQRTYRAEPIDAARPGSPWFLRPEGLSTPLGRLVGPSDYSAHLGANSGGANAVYWVEVLEAAGGGVRVRNITRKGKRAVPAVEQVIEPELLYPLLRWGDVSRYRAAPSVHIILAQDPATRTGIDEAVIRRRCPRTYRYMKRFEQALGARAAYKRYQGDRPFYSMYNVGTYTTAPIKVVWRRMDRRINAAVVEETDDALLGRRPVVPQETCVLIECDSTDEAHYVCAVLNSAIVGFLVAAHSVTGGKGFGTPGILEYVRLRRFDPAQRLHRQLAACSREAHEIVAETVAPYIIQQQIDRLAADLWDLEEGEFAAIRAEENRKNS